MREVSPARIEKIIPIGSFEVMSGHILASDPCRRSESEAGQTVFDRCAVGTWHAFVEDDGRDTYKLIAISAAAPSSLSDWNIALGHIVSVGSNQAGLFDLERYKFEEAFYDKICDMTLRDAEDNSQGKIKGVEGWAFGWGVVSATATGEGDFLCYTLMDSDGITLGIAIFYYKSYTEWKEICLDKILT